MPLAAIGLDIGGANLKAAHSDKVAVSEPFPLWKQPEKLAPAIQSLVAQLPQADHVAATMTGELCDCFASKEEGVRHILAALRLALPDKSLHLWRNDARLTPFEAVGHDVLPLAAANWLALACFVGRLVPRGPAILLDMGSTTTDIIPLMDGTPCPLARIDVERIRQRELVYVGASRTPLCALLGPPYAAEWFATTQDVYLLLGLREDDPEDRGTADGRPATRENAHARIARMLCADAKDIPKAVALQIAAEADRRLRQSVHAALKTNLLRVPREPISFVISGSGEFLIERIAAETLSAPPTRIHSFKAIFGSELSACACAFALAVLTQEHLSNEQPA